MKLSFRRAALAVLAALCALAAPSCVFAQFTTVSSSYLGGTGNLVANATIYWQPVQGFRIGSSSGQASGIPYKATVTAGVFSLSVPDTSLSDPQYPCYAVTWVDNVTGNTIQGAGLAEDGIHVNTGGPYACVQPAGSTWSFDTYVPAVPAGTLQVSGPAGTANWRGVWAASTAYAKNDAYVEAGNGYIVTTAYTSGSTFGSTDTANSVEVNSGCPLSGCTMTGPIVLPANPTSALQAATKQYVDSSSGSGLPANGMSSSSANGGSLTAPGSVTAGNTVSPLQAVNAYALRSLRTKEGLVSLNLAGASGYSSPAQITILEGGDSTGGFHSNEFVCTVATQYGVAGYIGSAPTGTVDNEGYGCPFGIGEYFAPTYSGGAAAVTGDFAHFPAGVGSSIPAGGAASNPTALLSTRIVAYYTANASGVTATVSTSTNGTTWTPITGCNAVAVTANVGNVCDVTLTAGTYYVQVSAGGTGTLYLWTAGQIDTAADGVVAAEIAVGGTSLPDQASIPSAIWQPWVNDIKPDVVTFEMKDNGVMQTAYPSCYQATTAAPTVGQTRAYWWNEWITPYQTANALADVIIFGSYDISDSCIPVYNGVEQSWAYNAVPRQTFVDNFSQLTNAQMQTLGWIDTSVHETLLGQVAHGDLDTQYLGIMDYPTAIVGQNVSNSYTRSSTFYVGQSGSVKGDAFGFIHINPNVGTIFANNATSPLTWATLADPTQAYGSTYNFLPPFQLSDLSATSNSGLWLAAISGHAGIYTSLGAGTLGPWYASALYINGCASGTYAKADGSGCGTPSGSFSLTTTGTSGAASYSGGVLNIPQYAGGGSMTWPAAAGIAVYGGSSAWGTSLTAPAGTIVGTTDTQTLSNKTVDGVTPTTMGYLDATSSVQTQLNSKQATLTNPVTGPGSGATVGHLAVMGNTSGTSITDGGAAPTALPPNGTASGDLSGSYPSPTVKALNGTTLSGLATGLLKNTTSTGAPSIAVAGTDYAAPNSNTTGTAGNITATSNSTLITLSSLSLPIGQVTGTINATQVNGAAMPTSANAVATNSSGQATAGTAHNESVPRNCTTTNSGNAYSCTTSPSFTPAAGDQVQIDFNAANTGSATLNVNGTSAYTIYKNGGTATLASGDLQSNHWVSAILDSSNHWQLEGQLGQVNATQVNGAAMPTSANVIGTNSSGQSVSASSSAIQSAIGSGVYDASGAASTAQSTAETYALGLNNAGSGSLIGTQVLTNGSGATYTPDTGTTSFTAVLVGPGGGGGGATYTSSSDWANGGGGGCGAVAAYTVTGISPGQTGTYTVTNAGGAGGANTGANGSTASSTTFQWSGGTTVTAAYGSGGVGETYGTTAATVAGGAGGAATNGTVNASGGPGEIGYRVSGTAGWSGNGCTGPWGGGGVGLTANGTGSNGTGYGSGGGGAVAHSAAEAGGNGGPGVIVVYEYGSSVFPRQIATVAPTTYSGTAGISATTIYTVPSGASHIYEMCMPALVTVAGTAGNMSMFVAVTNSGHSASYYIGGGSVSLTTQWSTNTNASGGPNACTAFEADASTNIQYVLYLGGATGSPTIAYSVTLQELQ